MTSIVKRIFLFVSIFDKGGYMYKLQEAKYTYGKYFREKSLKDGQTSHGTYLTGNFGTHPFLLLLKESFFALSLKSHFWSVFKGKICRIWLEDHEIKNLLSKLDFETLTRRIFLLTWLRGHLCGENWPLLIFIMVMVKATGTKFLFATEGFSHPW